VSGFQKIKPVRSEKYKAWVKQQSCCHCGNAGGDPHHCIGFDGIMGSKSDDTMLVSLCRSCHTELHNEFGWDKEGWLKAQLKWLQTTLRKAVADGVVVFG